MSHVFMIGATGGVGHRLHPMLIANGHKVSALHRKPQQAGQLADAGVTPVEGDITKLSVDDLAKAMKGADAVVFSAGAAGSGKDKTTAVDGDGAIKTIKAAQTAGITRFYLVSVVPDAGRDRPRDEGFEHYMAEKKRADVALAQSDLDWVILRPGTLQDDDSDGHVAMDRITTYGDVARGNVAAALAALIDTPQIRREMIEVMNGGTEVADAAQALIR